LFFRLFLRVLAKFSGYAIFKAPFSTAARLNGILNLADPLIMKSPEPHHDLCRRERQFVDILYAQGRATAAEVQAALPDPPSYSAVRAMLRILEEKGHVRHEQDGPRYVYLPTVGRDNAKKSALHHMLKTFFDGSAEQAISALLDESSTKLSDAELDRLARLIEQARNTGA
jgi:predicted transcriptional regulator